MHLSTGCPRSPRCCEGRLLAGLGSPEQRVRPWPVEVGTCVERWRTEDPRPRAADTTTWRAWFIVGAHLALPCAAAVLRHRSHAAVARSFAQGCGPLVSHAVEADAAPAGLASVSAWGRVGGEHARIVRVEWLRARACRRAGRRPPCGVMHCGSGLPSLP